MVRIEARLTNWKPIMPAQTFSRVACIRSVARGPLGRPFVPEGTTLWIIGVTSLARALSPACRAGVLMRLVYACVLSPAQHASIGQLCHLLPDGHTHFLCQLSPMLRLELSHHLKVGVTQWFKYEGNTFGLWP